eukprot:TRINITY_DN14875_c0_g2_i1.p1 TRINITY_DN14875_c0_g2~~TRINITY_DN14875_c0_g2_i1.p1  ORF type:complete len:121 (+),score=30.43 TRINITY_DN14875_c0_g2_i1:112-474(+)
MPVVYEEVLSNTQRFTRELAAGVRVIVPHFGMLNGGYFALLEEGIWGLDNVWVDTALADPGEITDYVKRYGHRKVLFGSDWPFGEPLDELLKVEGLGLTRQETDDICWNNVVGLHATSNL